MIRAETLQLRYIREPRFKWALWVLAAAACYGLAYTLAATNANTEFGNWPSNWELPMREPIDVAFDWVGDTFAWFFNPISDVIAGGVSAINSFLLWLPWPTVLAVVLIGGLKLGGRTLGLLSCGALLFIGLNGFWDSAVLTMSVVVVSVIIGVGLGVPLGILAAFSNRFEALVRPILDTMQVLPAFVYFIPALVLFGVSGAAGVFLTVVYSIPPVIRLTNLGIRQVPQAAVETAQSHGSTPLQTLLHVQLPLAKSSIMMGINQTIMMAVAMVIITALVGVGGLGWDVWLALRQVDAGDGLQSGIAIVLPRHRPGPVQLRLRAVRPESVHARIRRRSVRREIGRRHHSADAVSGHPVDGGCWTSDRPRRVDYATERHPGRAHLLTDRPDQHGV